LQRGSGPWGRAADVHARPHTDAGLSIGGAGAPVFATSETQHFVLWPSPTATSPEYRVFTNAGRAVRDAAGPIQRPAYIRERVCARAPAQTSYARACGARGPAAATRPAPGLRRARVPRKRGKAFAVSEMHVPRAEQERDAVRGTRLPVLASSTDSGVDEHCRLLVARLLARRTWCKQPCASLTPACLLSLGARLQQTHGVERAGCF
jgi:hypothetical protein